MRITDQDKLKAAFSRVKSNELIDAHGLSRDAQVEPITAEFFLDKLLLTKQASLDDTPNMHSKPSPHWFKPTKLFFTTCEKEWQELRAKRGW